ncbi:hypothetical protein MUK42_13802 [Musa troglodytarum]|uniref:Uncharacterized protein n=1 Tax=Musa troglodytarum TaxID=320322 RepID=A0A9E7I379_9LILI|nr:hypothetical protein MUK42_13802 [Musa troglodytarum]
MSAGCCRHACMLSMPDAWTAGCCRNPSARPAGRRRLPEGRRSWQRSAA